MQLETNLSTKNTLSYDLNQWQKGYRSLKQEYDYPIDEIEGQIPAELEGTLFRNGPGLLDINGQQIHHPFDGDGMISAITFQNGRAYYRNRFVRTQAFLEEQQAGKILYRGVFGTQKPGGWMANFMDLRLKNIANTQVIYWGGRLLALWEAAEPHRLDPATLETIGLDYLDGILEPGEAFGAHPRVDPACAFDNGAPCLVNFSIKPKGLSTTITIYELDPAGKLLRKQARSVPGFAFIHDFALTPNYCIFFQNPVDFNPLPFVAGLRGAGQCLEFKGDRPTQALIIPRQGSAPIQTIPIQAGFVFHHANAFEQEGDLFVDSICYDALPSIEPGDDYRQVDFAALAPGQLWRFRFNLAQNSVTRELLESRCCEFPSLHPDREARPYRYVYMGAAHDAIGNAPLQAVLKLDIQTGERQLWTAAPTGFTGEPVFVPRPNATAEDDGWLLTLIFDAKQERSQLVILNAQDLTQPIARLHLKHHVPYGLHGTFTPECFISVNE
ncbi:carotenoid oxygenase family protein [Leptolyngbya ohadii]|uniref:carotenoid oxygenase family protein n=1 Tax=Leptolyngbya ohadii TaxID=1962290 RepID=UPI000B59E265|nr:carotenoid oxygenase family protein [Leptolyngbya ohadii]